MRITIVCLLALLTVGCSSAPRVQYNPNKVDTTSTYTPDYRTRMRTGVKEIKVDTKYRCYKLKREHQGGGRCR